MPAPAPKPRLAAARAIAAVAVGLLAALPAGCKSTEERLPSRTVAGVSRSGRLVRRGDEALSRGDYPAAEETYRAAIDAAVIEPDSSHLTIALAQLAELERLRGRPAAGRAWLDDAEARASPEDVLGWSRYLLVRGHFERDEGRPDKAEATFVEHFDYCLENGLPDRALGSVHDLALDGDLEDRETWSERGISLAEDLGDSAWLAVLWNNLGWAYDEAGRHDDALEAFLEAHEHHEAVGDPDNRVAATWAVGRTYRKLGDLDDAGEWLRLALTRAESLHGFEGGAETGRWVGLSLWELAELAADRGRPREAFARLRDAHRILVEADVETWWPKGLARLEKRLAELTPDADA